MWFVLDQFERPGAWWLDVSIVDRVGWLAVSIGAGALAYFVVLFILGMRIRDFQLRQT
jgi:hypothetical protein